jgi:hypothetical protein
LRVLVNGVVLGIQEQVRPYLDVPATSDVSTAGLDFSLDIREALHEFAALLGIHRNVLRLLCGV